MIFTDTHAHLYLEQFSEDREEMMKRAFDAEVGRIFLPNIDLDSISSMLKLVADYPDIVFPMMGLHPCSVKDDYESVLSKMKNELDTGKYVAVGEIGIDLYWDKSTLDIQRKAFEIQIGWAKEMNLPIVIHARDSFDELFEVVDRLNDDRLRGVFHCFTGTLEQANHIIDYGGFYLGLGGVLTFKNSGLDKVISEVDLKHLVLETDAPYLSPTPFRGKRNESAYIPYIAGKLSEISGVEIEKVAEITTENSVDLFGV